MIELTLPSGERRQYKAPVSGAALAREIAPSLAKRALALMCDGELKDLAHEVCANAEVKIVTREDEEALPLLRHDAAHVMAQAVQELFPGTQVTIGPVIEDGFYYDFARAEPFSSEDLAAIEARMREIVARDEPVRREVWPRAKAVQHFRELGEAYKAELIAAIPEDEEISIYRHGETWMDLCRGPHLPSSGRLGTAFKLLRVAGAYWRGDSRNPMLQRIYGTCWANEAQLKDWLERRAEAERRDHRRLGQEMDLFHLQEEAQGMVFWHAKGWTLYRVIESYLRRRLAAAGYQEVRTPQLVARALWERSGHWEKFREHMFVSEADERLLALKPMNCPCHIEIFKQGMKSYRDLPLRMAEFGSCHRYEPSGALHGLMRVRNFVQDDAHIFCRPQQIAAETEAFCRLLRSVYADMGFEELRLCFADRPAERIGSDAVWDEAEGALTEALKAMGEAYELNQGDGAFYGPKIDFYLRDAIGRQWQCGTLQVDFNLPTRLGATYIGEDSARHVPILLHRAIFGSLERFIGILLEHYDGKLPLWLAPQQVMIATISEKADAYAREAATALTKAGVRVGLDLRNEKIAYKVREHALAKIPLLAVVGEREAKTQSLSWRRLGSPQQTTQSLDASIKQLQTEARPPA